MPTTRSQTVHERKTSRDTNGSLHAPRLLRSGGASSSMHSRRTTSASKLRSNQPDEPPRFVIDLSLPPEQRYLEVCAAMKSEIMGLTSLFEEVVGSVMPIPTKWLHRLCRLFLRGVHNDEENAELHGVSQATGVAMYLLVCFNVLLDLLMGCSSGGAAVRDEHGEGAKMLHFRTLDWDMPALRNIVVHLDFVETSDGPVIASSITYAGFVGVLTGVRKGLSLSLNFRPYRNAKSSLVTNLLYVSHLLMVLLGLRPSIASVLRSNLLPRTGSEPHERVTLYDDIIARYNARQTYSSTACYLCFSNGTETSVIEKDYNTSKVSSSCDFIVVTNNDEDVASTRAACNTDHSPPPLNASLAELLAEAEDRKQCAIHNWHEMRTARSKRHRRQELSLDVDDVIELVQKYPTTNEMTHFACVIDPREGKIVWCRRWRAPVGARWVRDHTSDAW